MRFSKIGERGDWLPPLLCGWIRIVFKVRAPRACQHRMAAAISATISTVRLDATTTA